MPAVATTTEAGSHEAPATVRVWDLMVRIFHWSLMASFTAAYISADEWERVHIKIGYIVAGLVASRAIWGLIGSKNARFTDFIYRPSTVLGFLRDSIAMKAKRYIGHNPAGGAMVIALLVAITAISTTGYMMGMDAYWGQEWVEDTHKVIVYMTLGLVALHVVGVLLASVEHKENLIKSMITGKKRA